MAIKYFTLENGQKVFDNAINRRIYQGNGFFANLRKLVSNLVNPQTLTNLTNQWTGSGLTDAEKEANQFSHNEAELAFQRELEASNTANQRKVADLQAAGINPMMAVSQGVSLPSSSAATSVSPSAAAFQLPQLFDIIRNMELLPLEKEKTKAEIAQIGAQTEKAGVETEKLRVDIEGSKFDNRSKEISLKYLDRLNEAEINMKESSAEHYNAVVRSLEKQIEKMDYEELEIFIRCCDTAEHINYLRGLESLTDAQVKEVIEGAKKLNADTRLLNLNIDNFDDITVVGSERTGIKIGPFGGDVGVPVTLRDLKDRANNHKQRLKEQRKWSDIKQEYPE